jgi:hypothetical protein
LGALLDALPTADVVVVDHRGLDGLDGPSNLVAAVPADRPVTITARRVPRAEIPTEPGERTAWLDGLWLELDAALRNPDPLPARPRSG